MKSAEVAESLETFDVNQTKQSLVWCESELVGKQNFIVEWSIDAGNFFLGDVVF